MKLEKMKAAVAGHYIPTDRAAEIYGAVTDSDVSQDFVDGALFALGFLTCPPEEEMHGVPAAEFLENYQRNKAAGDVPPEVLDAVAGIIGDLKEKGMQIGECFLIQMGEVR